MNELTKEQAEELRGKVTKAFRGPFPFNIVTHVSPFPPLLFDKAEKLGALCRPVDFEDLTEWACRHAKLYGQFRAEQASGGNRVYLNAWEPVVVWCKDIEMFKISTAGCVVESLAEVESVPAPNRASPYIVAEGTTYRHYESKGETKMKLEQGTVVKGGTNPPNTSDKRPPAPSGSGHTVDRQYATGDMMVKPIAPPKVQAALRLIEALRLPRTVRPSAERDQAGDAALTVVREYLEGSIT